MKFNDKIKNLLDQGKISAEQAQALTASLDQKGVLMEESGMHRVLPANMITAAALIAGLGVIIALVMSGSAGDTQTIQNVSEILNQSGKVGEMNRSMTSMLSIALFFIPLLVWLTFTYNSLVGKEENVLSSWAQVESSYQRRTDLIPNLVKTIRAYTTHEKDTLTDITRLRTQVDAVEAQNQKIAALAQGAAAHLNDEAYMASLAKAQQELGGNVKNFMMTVESYPALRSSDQYLGLQAELEGTENRINVARMAFNEKVNDFNASIRQMPGSLVAGFGKFQRKAYFKSDEGGSKAAGVDFGGSQK